MGFYIGENRSYYLDSSRIGMNDPFVVDVPLSSDEVSSSVDLEAPEVASVASKEEEGVDVSKSVKRGRKPKK